MDLSEPASLYCRRREAPRQGSTDEASPQLGSRRRRDQAPRRSDGHFALRPGVSIDAGIVSPVSRAKWRHPTRDVRAPDNRRTSRQFTARPERPDPVQARQVEKGAARRAGLCPRSPPARASTEQRHDRSDFEVDHDTESVVACTCLPRRPANAVLLALSFSRLDAGAGLQPSLALAGFDGHSGQRLTGLVEGRRSIAFLKESSYASSGTTPPTASHSRQRYNASRSG